MFEVSIKNIDILTGKHRYTVLSPYVLGLVYTIRVTRYPHHFFSLLSGEGESEMERERAKATGLAPSYGRRVTPAHANVPSRSPLRPERSEKRTLGIRVAVHYTGYSPVPTSEYIRRQYCMQLSINIAHHYFLHASSHSRLVVEVRFPST